MNVARARRRAALVALVRGDASVPYVLLGAGPDADEPVPYRLAPRPQDLAARARRERHLALCVETRGKVLAVLPPDGDTPARVVDLAEAIRARGGAPPTT